MDVTRTDEYTVATWLRAWYDLYAQPNIRQATADRYKLMIETYTIPRIGKIKLKKLTSRDLQKMYKKPDGTWPGKHKKRPWQSRPEQHHRPQRPPHAPQRI